MAKPPNAVAASSKNDDKPKRSPRQTGPRTLWIVLKPGSDAAAVRDLIDSVTFNGREVLKSMGTGVTPAVIKMQVAAEKREVNEDGPGGDAERNTANTGLAEIGSPSGELGALSGA